MLEFAATAYLKGLIYCECLRVHFAGWKQIQKRANLEQN